MDVKAGLIFLLFLVAAYFVFIRMKSGTPPSIMICKKNEERTLWNGKMHCHVPCSGDQTWNGPDAGCQCPLKNETLCGAACCDSKHCFKGGICCPPHRFSKTLHVCCPVGEVVDGNGNCKKGCGNGYCSQDSFCVDIKGLTDAQKQSMRNQISYRGTTDDDVTSLCALKRCKWSTQEINIPASIKNQVLWFLSNKVKRKISLPKNKQATVVGFMHCINQPSDSASCETLDLLAAASKEPKAVNTFMTAIGAIPKNSIGLYCLPPDQPLARLTSVTGSACTYTDCVQTSSRPGLVDVYFDAQTSTCVSLQSSETTAVTTSVTCNGPNDPIPECKKKGPLLIKDKVQVQPCKVDFSTCPFQPSTPTQNLKGHIYTKPDTETGFSCRDDGTLAQKPANQCPSGATCKAVMELNDPNISWCFDQNSCLPTDEAERKCSKIAKGGIENNKYRCLNSCPTASPINNLSNTHYTILRVYNKSSRTITVDPTMFNDNHWQPSSYHDQTMSPCTSYDLAYSLTASGDKAPLFIKDEKGNNGAGIIIGETIYSSCSTSYTGSTISAEEIVQSSNSGVKYQIVIWDSDLKPGFKSNCNV